MRSYTIDQLKHLSNVRALGFCDYADSRYGAQRTDFEYYSKVFFDWIEKMERTGKIEHLLSTMPLYYYNP